MAGFCGKEALTMSKVWHVILIICGILLVLGLALVGVALMTGGSAGRLLATTDIADMTKFFSREQLVAVVNFIFGA